MTHQAIAKELGLTRQTIGFLIRTGHRLPEVINDMPIRKVVKPMFDKTGEELFQHDRYYSF
jgi:DNA-binding XRE family transcriptional regulator